MCDPPLLRQLWNVHREFGHSVVAVEPVATEKVSDYGIIEGRSVRPGLYRCERFLEKPNPEATTSRLGITGAYVLTPGIFDAIAATKPGHGGEIQLTDAIAILAEREPVFASEFQGTRYDIGDRFLWLKTNLEFAQRDPELWARLGPVVKHLSENVS